MEDNKQPETSQSSNMMFEISDDFKKALRQFLGTKPFIEVADVIQFLAKSSLTEEEINGVINRIGKFPYDEVEPFFTALARNVKQVSAEVTEAESPVQEPELLKS